MSADAFMSDPIVRVALGWSLAVLFASAAWHKGRNLHVLGRLVIARKDALCEAAQSLRRPARAA